MLRKRAASARLRAVLGDVEDQIRGGSALSEAFCQSGINLSPNLYGVHSRGRAFGRARRRLEPLCYLHATQRCSAAQDSRRAGLSAVSAFASFCMVTFLAIYVVPRMSELFSGFGDQLPLPTKIVVGLSHWLSGNVVWFGPLVIVERDSALSLVAHRVG